MIDALGSSGELDSYYLFHAASADILRRLDLRREAAEAYRRALALATQVFPTSARTRKSPVSSTDCSDFT